MDIKDVPGAIQDGSAKAADNSSRFLRRAASALGTSRVEIRDSKELQTPTRETFSLNADRSKANQAISVVNLAEEATAEIEKLVASIDGIVEQASTPAVPTQRRQVLEREANQLVDEIRKKARVATSDGTKPLAGDKLNIPATGGGDQTEIVLPDTAQNAFGIGKISLDQQSTIGQTRAAISRARDQLEKLKGAVKDSKVDLKESVDAIEVALQNTEAAGASIRDVDQALKVAGDTRLGIARNPQGALNSVGQLRSDALELLK